MSDHDYDLDEINSAFADLRSASLTHVAPPGMTAARTTVRRRRQRRTVLLGIVGVLAVLIPVASFARGGGDNTAPPVLASPDSTPFTLPSTVPTPTPVGAPSTAPPSTPAKPGGLNKNNSYSPIWIMGELDGIVLDLPKSKAFTIPIGVVVRGKAVTNVSLAVDLTAIAGKVDIVSVGSPCSRSGAKLTCYYGSLGVGNHRTNLTLRAKSGASGSAGKITMKVTGTERSWHIQETWGKVNVTSYEDMADMVYTSTTPSARVGQTVSRTITAKNNGPSAQIAYEIGVSPQSGMQFVGVTGPGCTFTATHVTCQIPGIAVGSSVTIKVQTRVVKCTEQQRWESSSVGGTGILPDPVSTNNISGTHQVRVTGC